MEQFKFQSSSTNSNNSQNDSGGRKSKRRRKELILDTQGACFLCLQEPEETSGDPRGNLIGGVGVVKEVCLRNICRYLKISASSILQKSLEGGRIKEEKEGMLEGWDDKSDFSVTLCGGCGSIVRKLGEMIRELEVLKMLMNDKLKEFHGVLCQSEEEEDGGRWRELQEKLSSNSGNSNLEYGFLVEHLRQEAKMKSAARVNNYDSTCLLNLEMIPPEETVTNSHHMAAQSSGDSSPEIIEVDHVKLEPEVEIEEIITSPTSSNSTPSVVPYRTHGIPPVNCLPLTPSPNNYSSAAVRKFVFDIFPAHFQKIQEGLSESIFKNRCVCRICNATYPGPYIRLHLVREHVQIFFKHKRPQNLGEILFSDQCRRLLQSETDSAQRVTPTSVGPKNKLALLCSYCTVKHTDEHYLRFHLVTEHYHILEEKLEAAFVYPPDLLLISPPGLIDTGPEATGTVKEEFLAEDDDDDVLMETSMETLVESDSLSSKALIITEQRTATISLSRRYPSQMESPSSSTSIDANRATHLNQPNWKKFYDIVPDNGVSSGHRYKCLICAGVFNLVKIRHHLSTNHPEELFSDKRLDHVSDDTFKAQCLELMKQVTSQEGREKRSEEFKVPGQGYGCSFCETRFGDQGQLRHHVVVAHYRTLGEKLVAKQKENGTATRIIGRKGAARGDRQWIICGAVKGGGRGCGQKFLTNFELNRHKKSRCPSKYN